MKKVWIFGAGRTGENIYRQIRTPVSVEGFLDHDKGCWSKEKEGLYNCNPANQNTVAEVKECVLTF